MLERVSRVAQPITYEYYLRVAMIFIIVSVHFCFRHEIVHICYKIHARGRRVCMSIRFRVCVCVVSYNSIFYTLYSTQSVHCISYAT